LFFLFYQRSASSRIESCVSRFSFIHFVSGTELLLAELSIFNINGVFFWKLFVVDAHYYEYSIYILHLHNIIECSKLWIMLY
jgi:hypothetical protein